jgi:hypothetical protein
MANTSTNEPKAMDATGLGRLKERLEKDTDRHAREEARQFAAELSAMLRMHLEADLIPGTRSAVLSTVGEAFDVEGEVLPIWLELSEQTDAATVRVGDVRGLTGDPELDGQALDGQPVFGVRTRTEKVPVLLRERELPYGREQLDKLDGALTRSVTEVVDVQSGEVLTLSAALRRLTCELDRLGPALSVAPVKTVSERSSAPELDSLESPAQLRASNGGPAQRPEL